ncbi:hypothetical protein FRC01_000566 [Tulasnella sp. 417]|nr:hypothetical protein FRC01_000566 [Tulasnella sp. 417]
MTEGLGTTATPGRQPLRRAPLTAQTSRSSTEASLWLADEITATIKRLSDQVSAIRNDFSALKGALARRIGPHDETPAALKTGLLSSNERLNHLSEDVQALLTDSTRLTEEIDRSHAALNERMNHEHDELRTCQVNTRDLTSGFRPSSRCTGQVKQYLGTTRLRRTRTHRHAPRSPLCTSSQTALTTRKGKGKQPPSTSSDNQSASSSSEDKEFEEWHPDLWNDDLGDLSVTAIDIKNSSTWFSLDSSSWLLAGIVPTGHMHINKTTTLNVPVSVQKTHHFDPVLLRKRHDSHLHLRFIPSHFPRLSGVNPVRLAFNLATSFAVDLSSWILRDGDRSLCHRGCGLSRRGYALLRWPIAVFEGLYTYNSLERGRK